MINGSASTAVRSFAGNCYLTRLSAGATNTYESTEDAIGVC